MGKNQTKEGEKIPQHLRIGCVSSSLLPGGDSTLNERMKEIQFLPSWGLSCGAEMYNTWKHNRQPKMKGRKCCGAHK